MVNKYHLYLTFKKKLVLCIYDMIMLLENVRNIREKRENTGRSRVFYHIINTRDKFSVSDHTVLERTNLMKLHIFAAKQKVRTYSENASLQ